MKSKSPAFLFYTNDFTSGTMFFTDAQVGIYVRLLCAQHQHNRLSEKQVLHISKTLDEDILSKFKKDDKGLYYNERLEEEIEKRNSFSLSRSVNRSKKTSSSSEEHKTNISSTLVAVVDNDNEKEKEDSKKTFNQWQIFISKLSQVSKMKTQPTEEECQKLQTQFGQKIVEEVLLQMDNKPNLLKKYVSVYATALNWCKNYKAPAGSIAPLTGAELVSQGFGKLN